MKNEGDVKCEAVPDATQGHQCDGEEEDDDDSDDEDFDPDAVDEDASGRDSDDSKYSGGHNSDSDDETERRPSTERRVAAPKRKLEIVETPELTTEHVEGENATIQEDATPETKKIKIEK